MNEQSSQPVTGPFELGGYRIDPAANTITGPAGETTIEPKVMAVLTMLAENAGSVVTRSAFLDTIWAGEYGGDESLTRAVSLLRKVFGDGRGTQAFIETVPRRGYRLVASRDAAPSSTAARPRRWVLPAALLVLLLLAAVWALDPFRDSRQPVVAVEEAKTRPIVAVLPFDSQTSLAADQQLADGLADEVLSALTRTNAVDVIAGNSSFLFRGEAKQDLPRIVEQLGVTHVVDGAVRRAGNGLRVAIYLVDARSGLSDWSQVFERSDEEIYVLPGVVAGAILQSLAVGVSDDGGVPRRTPVPEAYRAFLRAQALLRLGELAEAVNAFEAAVAEDPAMAEAWAGLAVTRLHFMLLEPGQGAAGFRNRDPDSRLAAARAEAQKALELDPDSIEAQLALVIIDYRVRLLPLAEAQRRFADLQSRAPDNPEVNMRLGMMEMEFGRFERAVGPLERTTRVDPLSLIAGGIYLQALQNAGRKDTARRFVEAGRAPWYASRYLSLEQALLEGDFAAARGWVDRAARTANFGPHGYLEVPGPERVGEADDSPLLALLVRLVAAAEVGSGGADPDLPAALIEAADAGLILHSYLARLLAASGVEDPVFDLVLQRLAVDDLYIRGTLFRDVFARLRYDPRVMAWFDASTHLYYWIDTQQWPDFCLDPGLPYDCAEAALGYREASISP